MHTPDPVETLGHLWHVEKKFLDQMNDPYAPWCSDFEDEDFEIAAAVSRVNETLTMYFAFVQRMRNDAAFRASAIAAGFPMPPERIVVLPATGR